MQELTGKRRSLALLGDPTGPPDYPIFSILLLSSRLLLPAPTPTLKDARALCCCLTLSPGRTSPTGRRGAEQSSPHNTPASPLRLDPTHGGFGPFGRLQSNSTFCKTLFLPSPTLWCRYPTTTSAQLGHTIRASVRLAIRLSPVACRLSPVIPSSPVAFPSLKGSCNPHTAPGLAANSVFPA